MKSEMYKRRKVTFWQNIFIECAYQ